MNFATNDQSYFTKGYRVKSFADKSCHPHLFILKTLFKLPDQRLVVVCGGECRVINSRPLFDLSVSLLANCNLRKMRKMRKLCTRMRKMMFGCKIKAMCKACISYA